MYWLDTRFPSVETPNAIHYACIVQETGEPTWIALPGTGSNGAWTDDDETLSRTYRVLVQDPASPVRQLEEHKQKLYEQRIAPIADLLERTNRAVTHLIVLPSDRMSGLPVGTITDKYEITYAPSASMYAWIHQQQPPPRSDATRRLLAVGDPNLPPPDGEEFPQNGVLITSVMPNSTATRQGLQRGDILVRYAGLAVDSPQALKVAMSHVAHASDASNPEAESPPTVRLDVWHAGATRTLTVPEGDLGIDVRAVSSSTFLAAELAQPKTLRDARGGTYRAIPATRSEIEAIADLFGENTTVLLGEEATEQRVQHLATQDALREFSHIHFATHGELNEVSAFHSALILTPERAEDHSANHQVFDGRLTALQIIRTWKLNADLVTLSACDTGLGNYASGEGYQGFGHAFLLSGARSVVISLWKVDDVATYLLMTRFYENLLKAPEQNKMTKAAALDEAKVWLRSLNSRDVAPRIKWLSSHHRGTRPRPDQPLEDERSFAHPYYWVGFVLIGDHR